MRMPLEGGAQRHHDCAGHTGQGLRGDGREAAVAPRLCAALAPAPLTSALEAVAPRAAHARALEPQWPRRRERAHEAAAGARRRSQAVAPEHRWVARRLARDWHEPWPAVAPRERDSRTVPPRAASHVSEAERHRIVACAYDLPAGWPADTTTHAARHPVVRCLLQAVPRPQRATARRLAVRWHTHAWRPVDVARPQRA